MAGFKHRYIVVKIDSMLKRNIEDIKNRMNDLIYESLKTNFGEYVIGMADTLEVIECHEALEIAIIRCNLKVYKYVCYSIVSMGSTRFGKGSEIVEKGLKLSIIITSGILKKARKGLLEILNKDRKKVEN